MFWKSQKKFFYGIYLLMEAGILAGRVEEGYAQGKTEAKYGNGISREYLEDRIIEMKTLNSVGSVVALHP